MKIAKTPGRTLFKSPGKKAVRKQEQLPQPFSVRLPFRSLLLPIARFLVITPKVFTAHVGLLLAIVPAEGQILVPETLTFNGSFTDIDDFSVITEVDEGFGSAFGASAVVTGIPKFDPALGTLTGIRVSASYDYQASGDFFIDSVADPDSPYLAEVTSLFHEVGLNLRRTSRPGTALVLLGLTQFLQDSYFISDPDEQDSYFESGSWGFSDAEEDIFSSADLSDFVGSGEVSVLDAAVYVPAEGEFFLENVDAVTLETLASMSNGQVQVSYDYLPIPEPSTTMLAVSALTLGLLRRCRAPRKPGWAPED